MRPTCRGQSRGLGQKKIASRSVWLKWLSLFDRCSLVRTFPTEADATADVGSCVDFSCFSCCQLDAMIPSLIALLTWQLAAWLAFALVVPRPRTRLSISNKSTRWCSDLSSYRNISKLEGIYSSVRRCNSAPSLSMSYNLTPTMNLFMQHWKCGCCLS